MTKEEMLRDLGRAGSILMDAYADSSDGSGYAINQLQSALSLQNDVLWALVESLATPTAGIPDTTQDGRA